MARDRDRRVQTPIQTQASQRALAHGVQAAAWDCELPDDARALEVLRRAWLTGVAENQDDESGAHAARIAAATEPLSSALQEQIVQRLLREQRAATSRQVGAGASSCAWHRGPLWAVAAACLLCCWTAVHVRAPSGSGVAGRTRGQLLATPATAATEPVTTVGARRAVHDDSAALTELAETYAQQQRFAEAEALFQKALLEREERLGPAHKDVADALTRLASLYQTQRLYAKAEPLYVRALEIDPPFAVF